MLNAIGTESLDTLATETIPDSIRLKSPPDLPERMSEYRYLKTMRELADRNKIFRSYIGLGYYNTITPPAIQRNIFENPGWYTQYTPYQAEIAQGRLEALLNFQTMVMDLTAMEVANASLLDEATAAAEAMGLMLHNSIRKGEKVFFAADSCFPQTLEVLRSRCEPLGVKLITGDPEKFEFTPDVFGILLQYPGQNGSVLD